MASNIDDNIDTSLPAETSGVNVGKVLKATFTTALGKIKDGLTAAKAEITEVQDDIASVASALDGKLDDSQLIDDDTFASASGTNIPSAASVKAYVDANAGGGSTPLTLTFAQAQAPFDVAGISNIIVADLTSDCVVASPTGASVGQVLTYNFGQDSLGGHALTVHGVTMPLGQAGQVLACQFQYRGAGKWAQMFGSIPWSGTPSAVGFGDSHSLNTWTSLTGLVV